MMFERRADDRQSRRLLDEKSARRGVAQRQPQRQREGRGEPRINRAVLAQRRRQRQEGRQNRVGLGVEVAEHAGELRQNEREKESQHAAGGEEQKTGIAQRVENAPPQGFGARALGGDRFQDRGQHGRLLAEAGERDKQRREGVGTRAERFGKTLPRHHRGVHFGGDGAHAAEFAVVRHQIERVVDARAGAQQQRHDRARTPSPLPAAAAVRGARPPAPSARRRRSG